ALRQFRVFLEQAQDAKANIFLDLVALACHQEAAFRQATASALTRVSLGGGAVTIWRRKSDIVQK
ncbi:hypothetical protein, partial [Thioclava pacifica]|uniref:hypothetical protein n=1 Tax=Thioclava pacifica TaxID=285109 RepID=UPI00146F9921